MAMSLNTLKKLTKEEMSNMVLEYQNKFDRFQDNSSTIFDNPYLVNFFIVLS